MGRGRTVVERTQGYEDTGEHEEYVGLDYSNEQFKQHEGGQSDRGGVDSNESHHSDQHLTTEDVAE